MIISCPECNSKFKVDDSLIKENGRFVRCSHCAHEWVAMPTTSTNNSTYSDNNDIVPSEKQDDSYQQNKIVEQALTNIRQKKIATISENNTPSNSYLIKIFSVLLLTLSIIFATGVYLLTKRDSLIISYPSLQYIYDAIDLRDIKGLIIEDVFGEFNELNSENAGHKELNIAVAVKNLGEKEKILNAIQVSLFDANRSLIESSVIEDGSILLPNDFNIIEGRLNNVPSESKYFSVEIGNALDFKLQAPFQK